MLRGLGRLQFASACRALKPPVPAVTTVMCAKKCNGPKVPDLMTRVPFTKNLRCCSSGNTGKVATQNNSETEALSILDYLKEIKNAPVPALTLGLAGLIPFASVPMYLSVSGTFSPTLAFAQAAYGASILSFLGGVRWGFSVADKTSEAVTWENLGYSVTPSLVAWLGLLMPLKLSVLTMAGGLILAAYADVTMKGYSAWFKGLRLLLTIVAVTSLLLTLKHSLFLKENETAKRKENEKSSEV